MSANSLITRLGALGLLSFLLYAVGLAARYPVQASLEIPHATWATLSKPPAFALIIHILTYICLMSAYAAACQLVWRRATQGVDIASITSHAKPVSRSLLVVIVLGWLLSSFVLLGVAAGGESNDIFDYLFRGRMWVEYGGNPLTDIPRQFETAPFYQYVSWRNHVDTYGPLWEYTSGAVASLVRMWLRATGGWGTALPSCPKLEQSCQMLLAYVSGYRLLAVTLTGVSGLLIYLLVRRVRPEEAHLALLVWLWNPLLLVSSAVGAHNDLLLLTLLLLAFWFLQRQFWLAGLLTVVMAAHVKVTALILLPAIGLWLVGQIGWRRSLMQGGAVLGVALPLSWLLYAPLGGWGSLPRMLYERSLFVANSPFELLHRLLYDQWHWPYRTVWYITIFYPPLLFALASVVYSLIYFGIRKNRLPQSLTFSSQSLWTASAVVTMLFLAIGSFWFQHWYVLWALMFYALLPSSLISRRVLPWLCLGALVGNLFGDFLRKIPGWQTDRIYITASVVAVIWLPTLIASVYLWWKHQSANKVRSVL